MECTLQKAQLGHKFDERLHFSELRNTGHQRSRDLKCECHNKTIESNH